MDHPQANIEPPVKSTLATIWDKGKLFLKAAIIFFMALFLWIPSSFVMNLVKERQGRQKEAIADISNKWAGRQTVIAPILMIPYTETDRDAGGNPVVLRRNAYFIADKSDIQAKIFPEKRHRGIYEVIVYRTDVEMKGKFTALKWQQLKIPPENILWNEAALLFKVQDHLKGINEDISIQWNDSSLVFNPQEAGFSQMTDGFAASIPFNIDEAAKEHSYSMKFSVNGSEQLLFAVAAKENKLKMQSTWPDPGFTGVKLPDTREVSDSGFNADWKYLNRAVPQVWKNTFYDLSQSMIGADLLVSIDSYNKTERSVKYALLCIVLTFAAFFLIETIYRKPLHLVQYGLAGLALVLFYTLLLSISEYIGFNPAYLISAIATIGLIGWFIGGIMRSAKLAVFIGMVLSVVYGYIFSIIQLQDYSLLMGSIGLFVALAIIMYFSRKLQW